MAIVFESSTYIENILKNALMKSGIEFEEQYRIYTGGRFSTVKYVADFFISNSNVKLLVECDGLSYHEKRKEKDKERDNWLRNKGYRVIRFSSSQIRYQTNEVIACISANLTSNKPLTLKGYSKNALPIYQNANTVALFCYYFQNNQDLLCVYKYKSIVNGKWSAERKCVIRNVPPAEMPAVAIYKAMLDLKRAVNIKVFFNGHASAYQYNTIFGIKKHFPSFSKGKTLLKHNWVSFEYCNIDAHSMFDKREDIKVMRELKSRCYQIMNYSRMRNAVCEIEYDELTHIEKKTDQG